MDHLSRESCLVFAVKETGKVLKISPTSVRKASHEGRILAIQSGRKFLIPRAELEKMLGSTTHQD